LAWTVELTSTAKKELKKIDKAQAQRIVSYLRELSLRVDPRSSGKPLTGKFRHYWRYRVGDYRIISEIRDGELIIVAVSIGHRKNVYTR